MGNFKSIRNRPDFVSYLCALLGLLLVLTAPFIFSFLNSWTTGYYVVHNETGSEQWVPGCTWGVYVEMVTGIGLWILVPLLIYGLVAQKKTWKSDVALSILVLILGIVTFEWSNLASSLFSQVFGVSIDESYIAIGGMIGIVIGGLPLIIDLIGYNKRIGRFVISLPPVKQADIVLKRTEFRTVGFEERSNDLFRKTRKLKWVFHIVSLLALFVCLYYVFQNITYFISILLSIDLSLTGLLGGTIAVVQNFFTLYVVSVIPAALVFIFGTSLLIRPRASDVGLTEADQDKFVELVRSEAAEIGVTAPKVAYKREVPILETIKCEKSNWIIANPQVINLLLENHLSELRAATAHELSHIRNGDVNDKTRMYNIHSSLELGTSRLMLILGPLAALFPFSLVLVTGPPVPSIVAAYFEILTVGLLLIGIGLIVEWLKNGIMPVHVVTLLVCIIVGVVFLPFAIFWGKLNSLIERRADLEAAKYLQSIDGMVSLLKLLQTAIKAEPKEVINQKAKKIGAMLQEGNWRNYSISIPLAVLEGIYDFCQRYYLNINSRIKNLTIQEDVRPTRGTAVRQAILSIARFFTDIPRNKGSMTGLAIGFVFSPVIFVIHYFPNNGNLIITTFLTIITIMIIAKIGKYVREFSQLIKESL